MKRLSGKNVSPNYDGRVIEVIRTHRLFLLALKQEQLQLYLQNPSALEGELLDHAWCTYWLIVPKANPIGIG